MAKKELYYYYVSINDKTNERAYYYGVTVATSQSKAESQAFSYIHEKYYSDRQALEGTAVADPLSCFENFDPYNPDTIAISKGIMYKNLSTEDTLEPIEIKPKKED